MTLGYTDGKTKIKIGFFVTCILSVLLLTGFELRKVVAGPDVTLTCSTSNCEKIFTDKGMYILSGKTSNISDIHIGNRKIYTDTQGLFNDHITLYPGPNFITIYAKDRFGKEVKKEVSVYYENDSRGSTQI